MANPLSRGGFFPAGGTALGLSIAWRRGAGVALADTPPVACPASNPIVDENWCTPVTTWSDAFQLGAGGAGTNSPLKDRRLLLYPTASSVDSKAAVDLAIASYHPDITRATLEVYRLGYYGGA